MACLYAGHLLFITLLFILTFTTALEIDFSTINIEQLRHTLLAGAKCTDIIDKFMERIENFEKGSLNFNELVTINQRAKEEAQYLDQHFSRTRSLVGTLHCVPIVVSDNIDVAHLPTTAGVKALSLSIAPRDADVVQLLKNQGAVVMAKGNVSPFAWEHRYVESQTGGVAKNVYCLSCTPYGASAGSAQATAVVYGLIGLGTDTGGSIALPASAASCLGLRPTWNLVSTRGVMPVHAHVDVVGPFVRYASDLAVVMDVLDPSKRGRGHYSLLSEETGDVLNGIRIGVLGEAVYDKIVWPMSHSAHSSSLVAFHLNEQIKKSTIKAIGDMKSIGADISNVTLNVHRVLPYLAAFGAFDITSCSATWLNPYFNRLSPSSPFHNLSQLLASRSLPDSFQRFYQSSQRRSILQQCDTASETFHQARSALIERIIDPLFNGDIDALLFPMTPDFPPPIHDRRDQPLMAVQLASLAGYPSLTLPVGFESNVQNSRHHSRAPLGLPVSVLLMAKPERMDALIKVASAYQSRFGKVIMPQFESKGHISKVPSVWMCALSFVLLYL